MICAINLQKRFDKFSALDNVNVEIPSGCVYGLVGTNGSGKSTFLRLLAGVYYPNEGLITLDGESIYDNAKIKTGIFFLPDTPFYFHQGTVRKMADFYKLIYQNFDVEIYRKMLTIFPIDPKAPIASMSKGMQRQAALILPFACRPRLLLLDEAFGGLDPFIRKSLKSLISESVAEYGMTVMIASHNLRELEDLCDHVGLIHQGHFLLNSDIDDLKGNIQSVQIVLDKPAEDVAAAAGLELLHVNQMQGSMQNWIIRGDRDEVLERLNAFSPKYLEAVAPTLEEIFIWTTEVPEYDVSKIIL